MEVIIFDYGMRYDIQAPYTDYGMCNDIQAPYTDYGMRYDIQAPYTDYGMRYDIQAPYTDYDMRYDIQAPYTDYGMRYDIQAPYTRKLGLASWHTGKFLPQLPCETCLSSPSCIQHFAQCLSIHVQYNTHTEAKINKDMHQQYHKVN